MSTPNFFSAFKKKVFLLGVLTCCLASLLKAQHDPRQGGWAHDHSSLDPDPNIIWGALDNGLRYAFLPHDGVPGRFSLRLLVLAGSLDEKNRERGLAHFLEHMAFNGTRNFDQDELTGYFLRLGMEFGSDVNAYTTYDRTVYGLEFTGSPPEVIREGFALFRDFADEILLDPREVDKERGVILSELRIHDGVGMRVSDEAKSFFYRGLLLPERSAIGTPKIIRSASAQDLREFYERLYRPDLMVLVGVGDLDFSQFENWTREYLGTLKKETEPIPRRNEGKLNNYRSPRARVLPIQNSGSVNIRVASSLQERRQGDSLDYRRQENHRKISSALLGKRLQEQLGTGSASYDRIGDLASATASLSAGPQQWDRAVLALDEEIRKVLAGGFDSEELDTLRSRFLLDLNLRKAQAPRLDPKPLADALEESIAKGQVYLGYAQELELDARFIREASPRDLEKAFKELWSPEEMAFFLSGEVQIEGGSKEVVEVIEDARKQNKLASTSNLTNSPVPSLYDLVGLSPTGFQSGGRKGQVVETRTIPDFQASLMRFDNNIRLNVIESDQEPGLVRTLIRVGGGLFQQETIRKGLREFALDTVLASGTEYYPFEHFSNFLDKNLLEFNFDVSDHDAFTFRGLSAPDSLEEYFNILADFLRNPQFSHEAHKSVRFNAAMGRMQGSSGLTDGMRAFQDYLFEEDGRFAFGSPEDYRNLHVRHVREWIGKALAEGYVEISIIGDVSREQATDIVARTFGTLSERQKVKPNYPIKPVQVSAPAGFERLEFIGETHQALAMGMWPFNQNYTLEERLGLLIISRVLEQRIRLQFRERLGLAYSPATEFIGYPEYGNFAIIRAHVDCAPEDAETIARSLADIANELAREGMSENEFLGAVNPVQSRLQQALLENATLLNRVLIRAQESPESIEEMRAIRDGAYKDLDLDFVNALMARVLGANQARTAALVPKPFVGVFRIDTDTDGQNVIGR